MHSDPARSIAAQPRDVGPPRMSPQARRAAFDACLARALTCGHTVTAPNHFGPLTAAAINAVARAHPEAATTEIVAAYDAYDKEHPA